MYKVPLLREVFLWEVKGFSLLAIDYCKQSFYMGQRGEFWWIFLQKLKEFTNCIQFLIEKKYFLIK